LEEEEGEEGDDGEEEEGCGEATGGFLPMRW
jgi:hypothetical protein